MSDDDYAASLIAVQKAALALAGDVARLELPPREVGTARVRGPDDLQPLYAVLAEVERRYLIDALRVMGGRKAETARALGISRKTLWQKLQGYKIEEVSRVA
jgi:DNA-binding NtrC family response regulator